MVRLTRTMGVVMPARAFIDSDTLTLDQLLTPEGLSRNAREGIY